MAWQGSQREYINALHCWPFVRRIQQWLQGSLCKGPVSCKVFPCIMSHRMMFGITCMWNILWPIHDKMWWSSGIFHKLFPLDDPKGSKPFSLSTGFMLALWIVTAFVSFCLFLWMLWIMNTIWSWCFYQKLNTVHVNMLIVKVNHAENFMS